jgi:lipid-A-disaccharide synthase
VINSCDLIITIPGTNTAQIASFGCPMVVVAPLNKADEIPLDGIAGYMQVFPFIGRPLKRFLVKKFSDKLKWTAIPNTKAQSEIVPEVRGIVRSEKVVERVKELIEDEKRRTKISEKLKEVMGQGGAAEKIAGIILSLGGKDD